MFLSINQKTFATIFFDSVIMLKFGKTKVTKEEFYGARRPM